MTVYAQRDGTGASDYLYLYIAMASGTDDDDDGSGDYVQIYFDKDGDEVIENDDEGLQKTGTVGTDTGRTSYIYNSGWTTTGASVNFEGKYYFDTNVDLVRWELKIQLSDTGLDTSNINILIFHKDQSGADTLEYWGWPDFHATSYPNWKNDIDYYGTVPEFTPAGLIAVVGSVVLFGSLRYRRKIPFSHHDCRTGFRKL